VHGLSLDPPGRLDAIRDDITANLDAIDDLIERNTGST
jgi:hypothetical protein